MKSMMAYGITGLERVKSILFQLQLCVLVVLMIL